jgi:hypothetical protein
MKKIDNILSSRPAWRTPTRSSSVDLECEDGTFVKGKLFTIVVLPEIDNSRLDFKIQNAIAKAVGTVLADAGIIERDQIG